MQKRKMWVLLDDDADLSQSRKRPGSFSPLTRDEDNNLGQVILEDIDDDDGDPGVAEPETVYIYVDESVGQGDSAEATGAEVVAGLVFVAALLAIEHRSEIAKWWADDARPALSRIRSRLRWRRRAKRTVESTVVGQLDVEESESAEDDVTQALEGYRESMASDEARDRLISALMAQKFAEQQLAMVRNARIVERDAPDASLSLLEAITPEELEAGLRHLLERKPALLESGEIEQVGKSLRHEVVVEIPPRQRLKEAARRVTQRRKSRGAVERDIPPV